MEQQTQQPNQPLAQTSLDEAKRQKSKRIKIAFLALAAVFLVFGGIFLLKAIGPDPAYYPTPPAQQTPSPSPQPQAIDISDWQTYRNDEFGFEVRYPANWRLELKGVYNGFNLRIRESEEEYVNISNVPIKTEQEILDVVIANTRIYDSSNSPRDWVECGSGGPCPPPPSRDKVSIRNFGGNSFYYVFNYLFEGQYGVVYYMKNPDNNTAVRFLLKGFTRSKDWTDPGYNVDEEPNHSTLKQILSTFRFVE